MTRIKLQEKLSILMARAKVVFGELYTFTSRAKLNRLSSSI
jgi:hypothetical protein